MRRIISYIGFAIKSKKVISGQTAIKLYKGKINLIMVCSTASDNLINLAKNIAIRHNCELIITKPKLEELSNIKDVKIIALTDESLSQAIIKNKEIINIG